METHHPRLDDVVRSERYFTATLLPAILFHDNFRGLEEFSALVDRRAVERGVGTLYGSAGSRDGQLSTDPIRVAGSEVELITEFHIARDLRFAGLLPRVPSRSESVYGGPEPRQDAPDLVIVVGDNLIVCEGKFFGDCDYNTLNVQLQSQRVQVEHLFRVRPFRPYRHVAILPFEFDERPDCTATVTWEDVEKLSCHVLGHDHYVSRRLQDAVRRYKRLSVGPRLPYFDGVLELPKMIQRCRDSGASIQVGFIGGEEALRAAAAEVLPDRLWRWRRHDHPGRVNPRNWISGETFLEIVRECGALE